MATAEPTGERERVSSRLVLALDYSSAELTHRIFGHGRRKSWNGAVGSERWRRHLSLEMTESSSDGEMVVLPRRAGQQPRRVANSSKSGVDILDGVGQELDHLEEEQRGRLSKTEVSE